jgi:phospholipid-transporting ATPase
MGILPAFSHWLFFWFFRCKQVTTNHLEAFAREGLRTLCCAVAEIPHDIYEEWKHTYHRASVSMQNREEKLADAANLIENNLVLLGATAIEDKLQDQVNLI